MQTLQDLQSEINQIKDRNKKVEADKAWETSYIRRILIAIITYILVAIFFSISGNEEPLISALVPTLGFLLSTLTLSYFKSIWIKQYENKAKKI